MDAGGEVTFSELFERGKDTLVVYSFMFPRDPGDLSPGPATGQTALLPLEEGPMGYRIFKEKQNEVTKVVLKPGQPQLH